MQHDENYSLIGGIRLRVGPSFDGVLPVSPCRVNYVFEPHVVFALSSLLRPGAVVLDVGSSWGVIAALSAQLVGPGGRVYAFEANPETLPKIVEILKCNGLNERVQVINLCIGEESDREVAFHLVPGFKAVSSSRAPAIASLYSDSRTVAVPLMALDDLYPSPIAEPPDLIKIDVEGSEYGTIMGARNLLRLFHPDLIVETHGAEIEQVCGSLPVLCQELADSGYRLFDLKAGRETTPEDYATLYANETGQLLASMQLRVAETLRAFSEKHRLQNTIDARWTQLWRNLSDAREYLNSGAPERALPLLRDFLVWAPQHPEAHYLLGLAFHISRQEPEEARLEYRKALECGFDEFWVRYNLGNLEWLLGRKCPAVTELRRAIDLNPEHLGPRQVLEQIEGSE